MLTNQSQPPKPIRILLGPEIFYGRNPMGLNMEHLIAFQRTIIPAGMFRFDYVAFEHSARFGLDQRSMVQRLKNAGIPLDATFTKPKASFEETQTFFRELMFQMDMVYPTEVLKHFELEAILRNRFAGTRIAFVKALAVQSQTTAEWNPEKFREFAALSMEPQPLTQSGPKAYRKRV